MKAVLTQNLVLALTFENRPTIVAKGRIEATEPNASGEAWYVFDDHREAPLGFAVKVAKTLKTYIVQRKVAGRTIRTKVGNVRDFPGIDSARSRAVELARVALDTGRNPSAIAAEKSAAEITLGQTFDRYLDHLNGKSRPAKPNTIKAIGKARAKLASWKDRPVRDLNSAEILKRFDDIASNTRTTAEQTFRWATAAVGRVIDIEAHDAASRGRIPTLSHNPFDILRIQSKFRDKEQLEKDYARKGIRNPLTSEGMGRLLDTLWNRRRANRTGCDYLLCSLIWGTRKGEGACLVWRDLLTDDEAAVSSFADLDGRLLMFRDTKNHNDHELPMSDAVLEVLKQRREMNESLPAKLRRFVFPAESRFSKTGHYTDPRSLLHYIATDAGLGRLSPHDLRRSFGRLIDSLGLPYKASQRLLNHGALNDTSTRYMQPEWPRLCEYMQRIEDAVLATAPTVYNALRRLDREPIMEYGNALRPENPEPN